MKNSLQIIIFSFNRAMQLDCLIRSIFERIKNINYKIAIIFHCSEPHKLSYERLQEEYKSCGILKFYERSASVSFRKDKLPYLFNSLNLARFIKHKYFRKKGDNFKRLTEDIIGISDMEFTMSLTDDGYFFDNVTIPEKLFEIIRNNPEQSSYRMYVGDNLVNFPSSIKKTEYGYNWNYLDSNLKDHWSYPFAVDATIYHTKSLLKIIKPVLYHMPVTLESTVLHLCKTKLYFTDGWSPFKSVFVGISLNRVANVLKGRSGNMNPDLLKEYFIEGYRLNYDFIIPPLETGIIPDKLILHNVNGEKKIIEIKDQTQYIR